MKQNINNKIVKSSTLNTPCKSKGTAHKNDNDAQVTFESKCNLSYMCERTNRHQIDIGRRIKEPENPTFNNICYNFIKLVGGLLHSLSIDKKGKFYSWGCSTPQVLRKHGNTYLPDSVNIDHKLKVVDITADDNFSETVLDDGSLFIWDTIGSLISSDGNFNPKLFINEYPFKLQTYSPFPRPVSVIDIDNGLTF